jgi:nucleoside-diphosphate-sugar epimerase
MKLLLVGGTGLLSSACAELAAQRGHELYILNRSISLKYSVPKHATLLAADIRSEPEHLRRLLGDHHFDVVFDFIAFTTEHIENDLDLFKGKTGQFVFISSASAYQKPPGHYILT